MWLRGPKNTIKSIIPKLIDCIKNGTIIIDSYYEHDNNDNILARNLLDETDGHRRGEAEAAILNKFGYFAAVRITAPLSRIAFMDPVELADHACTAFRNRLARELALGPQAPPPLVADLEIDGTEFEQVVKDELKKSVSYLLMILRPIEQPAAEVAGDLRRIRDRCSPAEQQVVDALLAANGDHKLAAMRLGRIPRQILQTMYRINRRINNY